MTVREYIGARFVPFFMGDWDNTNAYEPLSIVQYQGNSYTSRQSVPTGIDITNTAYWALTGNYNAQVEAYRQEVQNLANIIPDTEFSSTNTVKDYIDNKDVSALLPATDFSSSNTVKDYIDGTIGTIGDDVDALEDMLPASDFSSANTVKDYIGKSDADVTKYGAKPNTPGLDWQSIFDSCVENGNGIYFPNGIWIIDGEFTIDTCSYVAGDNSILSFNMNTSHLIISNPYPDDIENRMFVMSGIIFDGNRIAENAITFTGSGNQGSVNNCHFRDFIDTCVTCVRLGLFMTACSFIDTEMVLNDSADFKMTAIKCTTDNVITNCKFFHCKYSIRVDSSSIISNCYFYGASKNFRTNYGIWQNTVAMSHLKITNCEFDTLRYCFSNISYSTIENCMFLWDSGIFSGTNAIFFPVSSETLVSTTSMERCSFYSPISSTDVDYAVYTFVNSSEYTNVKVSVFETHLGVVLMRKAHDEQHKFCITAAGSGGITAGTMNDNVCLVFEAITSQTTTPNREIFEVDANDLKICVPAVVSNARASYRYSCIAMNNPIIAGSNDRTRIYVRAHLNTLTRICLNGAALNMVCSNSNTFPTQYDWNLNANELATS